MSFSPDLDQAYSQATPEADVRAPSGWYHVRAVSAAATAARTGALGLRIELAIADGPHAGLILSRTFWLTGRALSFSKQALDALGFNGMTPSQIEAVSDFASLPTARAFLGYREYQGRPVVELGAFQPVSEAGATDAGPEAAPPAGPRQ